MRKTFFNYFFSVAPVVAWALVLMLLIMGGASIEEILRSY